MVKSFEQPSPHENDVFKPKKEAPVDNRVRRAEEAAHLSLVKEQRAEKTVEARRAAGLSDQEILSQLKEEYADLRNRAELQHKIDPALKEELLYVEDQMKSMRQSGASSWVKEAQAQRGDKITEAERIADRAMEAHREALMQEQAELQQLESTPAPKGLLGFYRRFKRQQRMTALKQQIREREQLIRAGESRKNANTYVDQQAA